MLDIANRTENVRVDPSQVSLKPPTELSQPTSAVSRYSKLHSVVPTSSVAGERERENAHTVYAQSWIRTDLALLSQAFPRIKDATAAWWLRNFLADGHPVTRRPKGLDTGWPLIPLPGTAGQLTSSYW